MGDTGLTEEMNKTLKAMQKSLSGNVTSLDASIQRVAKADKIIDPGDRRTSTRYSEQQAAAVGAIEALSDFIKFEDIERHQLDPDGQLIIEDGVPKLNPNYGQQVGGLGEVLTFVKTYENCMVSLNGESLKEFKEAIMEHPIMGRNYTHVSGTAGDVEKPKGTIGRVMSALRGG